MFDLSTCLETLEYDVIKSPGLIAIINFQFLKGFKRGKGEKEPKVIFFISLKTKKNRFQGFRLSLGLYIELSDFFC